MDKKVSENMDTQIFIKSLLTMYVDQYNNKLKHHTLHTAFKNVFLKPTLFTYRPLIAKCIYFLTFCVHFITKKQKKTVFDTPYWQTNKT